MADTLEGISIANLSKEEKARMKRFGPVSMGNYPVIKVPAGRKHQLVFEGNGYIGVATSRNGRNNFRQYDFPVSYTQTCSNFVFPRKIEGID